MEVSPNPQLGQHFLVDPQAIETIVNSIPTNSSVVEIGAGSGLLTSALVRRAKEITAVEVDKRFYPALKSLSGKKRNLKIIIDDFLSLDLKKLISSETELVGSLPYHIIEPLFLRIFPLTIKGATFVVGSRLIREILSSPELPNFGKLTQLINTFYDWRVLRELPRESFEPQPPTPAAIIRLTLKPKAIFREKYYYLIRRLFLSSQRGAKVKNVLKEGFIKYEKERLNSLTQNQARTIILTLDLPTTILNKSFEQLSNEQLAELFIKIKSLSDEG